MYICVDWEMFQLMVYRLLAAKWLPEPMMTYFNSTHINNFNKMGLARPDAVNN